MDRTYEKYLEDPFTDYEYDYNGTTLYFGSEWNKLGSKEQGEYFTDDDENECYGDSTTQDWSYGERNSVLRKFLNKSGSEYLEVLQLFEKTGSTKKFSLAVSGIEKVYNVELIEKFEAKKAEYKEKYGHVRIVKVFHGTKSIYIPSILKNNLEVQRHGQSTGHRFGAGVSFSALASYASHYCDESGSDAQMLLCHVIISNITEVPEKRRRRDPVLKEPPFIEGRYPLRYDTTAKNKESMDVIVKFENHTFYPAYIIHFVKTPKSISASSASVSVVNTSFEPTRTSTKDKVEEREVPSPFFKSSADVPSTTVPGFRPNPTPILDPLARTQRNSIGSHRICLGCIEPATQVVPQCQERFVPRPISRPTPQPQVVPRRQESLEPELVSRPTSQVVPKRQGSFASGQVSIPTPQVVPRRQKILVPELVSRPTSQVVPKRQGSFAVRQISGPTTHVVPRRQNTDSPAVTNVHWNNPMRRIPAVAHLNHGEPTLRSTLTDSLSSFFRKVFCCSSGES